MFQSLFFLAFFPEFFYALLRINFRNAKLQTGKPFIETRNLFTPKSLLLPIHSVYADKIFAGSKKYEYRKRLCKGFIKKIYIYETAPVKKITGEVDVLRKLRDKKESLWELTHHAGGIGLEAYNQYFNRGIHACAYELGNARKYRQPRRLEEFGITYPPQGAVYVNQEF